MAGVRGAVMGMGFAAAVLASGPTAPALAQSSMNDLLAKRQGAGNGDSRLLVEAREIVYNNDRNTVSAVGDVELNYGGRTLQADRVTLDRNTNRVLAEGNVRLTEANGQTTTGSRFELTDDFKSGFIDSLRVTQPINDTRGLSGGQTTFTAPRGERVEGDTTTFLRGTYTACEACRDDPARPPLWQVKAGRIIHNNEERTIYYEDATLEFGGIPVAYVPYFWSADPSVKRMTGFLAPHYIHTSALGTGVALPFFWDIAPDKDLTLTPTILSKQGVLGQAEYRQRLINGSFSIRAAGIFQQDKSRFLVSPYGAGDREARGYAETTGYFNINDRWHYGWDIALLSDKWFLQNYKIRSPSLASNYVLLESTSQIYLQGIGDRSFFDMRGYYFQGLSYADWQKQLPLVAPVLDYDKRINGPEPIGGELAFQLNFTNVHRDAAQFQPIFVANRSYPFGNAGTGIAALYESCVVFQRGLCLVRGLSGDFARLSAEASWRRAIVDDVGQVWTPFAYVRADGFFNSPDAFRYQNSQIANFVNPDENAVGRVMPAVGLEYRYPFVADAGPYGTHTLTPIGQIIARPNETRIGRLPNEDAHSLVYDDTTLFNWDKFSGYDRVEGGVRANVGLQYNMIAANGWTANALFGQSYQVAGPNSFSKSDLINTGLESGLDSRVSDYVGRVQVNPNENYSLIVRARFDHKTFDVNSFEAQGVVNFKPIIPLQASLTYVRYEAQPLLGYTHRREGLQPAAAFSVTPHWSVGGSVLFDLDRYLDNRDLFTATYLANYVKGGQSLADTTVYRRAGLYTVSQAALSLGYKDECTTFSINYAMTPRIAATGEKDTDRTVLVRLELRTLGQAGFSQTLASSSTSDGISSR